MQKLLKQAAQWPNMSLEQSGITFGFHFLNDACSA
jgi:hypothetical protein